MSSTEIVTQVNLEKVNLYEVKHTGNIHPNNSIPMKSTPK